MGGTLETIAQQLKDSDKKVQLTYAFNGTGKTRLSRAFKELVAPKSDEEGDEAELARTRILYYNAFTEDLFYWDNDLENDAEPKLKIQPNSFTDWVLKDQGQDQNIIEVFQQYTDNKLTPRFNQEYKYKNQDGEEVTVKAFSEVTFTQETGDEGDSGHLKISKGEESNFIWSVFYTLLDQVMDVLAEPEPEKRETGEFDQLEYIFIDDPVSSLDENRLIEQGVDLAYLIRNKAPEHLKFFVSTHSTVFYKVLYSELSSPIGYILRKYDSGAFELDHKPGASNTSFSYHLYAKQLIEEAVQDNRIQRFHFNLLRNLYEKVAAFLGYGHWTDILPDDKKLYEKKLMNFYSHRSLSNEEVAEPSDPEKQTIKFLLDHLTNHYRFQKGSQQP